MAEAHRVVVGYDGSDFSMQALDWALDECELRRLPLTVTHAWRWPYGQAAEEAKLHLRKAAEHVLYHGAECARSSSTLADVQTDLYEGSPAERIVELSAGADLVVIGSRGLGALARSLVGSVTAYVAAHSQAPLIIVRGPGPLPAPAHPGPVVLGLSPATPDAALRFAFDEAALRRLPVVIVHAVHLQTMAWGVAMAPVPDVEALTRAGQNRMEERLAPWRERHAEVRVEVRAVIASAKEALRAAAAQASLLVVGAERTRHHGHLGTVVRAVAEHAACPIAVVPGLSDDPPSG
ncbi:universal stress protein [Nonomuraea zeae]|uniref:Universal stress protein n=1 Tax=Nonomuraea zeae TaxID=1642303 RepID=A0A5S4GXG3_9ACTN|nr:universal stress protein [Nonomuraea zeae]TMR37499.1 universal stress protein [Nonomuraea zeae]